jgi:N-acetylglucosaminyldiphosphoundecaprenol N-acetyl-beta-D-mannosaminyltransferase
VNLLGVTISTLPVEAVISRIESAITSREKIHIAYANIYALNLAYEQAWFREYLNSAALTFCDGYGVIWGAKILGLNIPYRYTPPDWFDALMARCADRGFSIFFLGSRPGVAEKAARILSEHHPGVQIKGVLHGFFDKQCGSLENQAVINAINAIRPDLLVVGLGMPTQEKWLAENWAQINAYVAFPVGAMLDYLTGEVRRAPRWMTDHGLEWLGRLIIEPRRLWQRYLIGNSTFLGRLLKQKFLALRNI